MLFIAQFEHLHLATINEAMQPELANIIRYGQLNGLNVLAYNCQVTADCVNLKQAIPFDVEASFEDPNK